MAAIDKITENFFSSPKVLTIRFFWPILSIIVLLYISKYRGVSSIFIIESGLPPLSSNIILFLRFNIWYTNTVSKAFIGKGYLYKEEFL